MKTNRILAGALMIAMMISLLLPATAPALAAEEYTSIRSGSVASGEIVTIDGYFIKFDILNGSNAARVNIRSAGYAEMNYTIIENQYCIYYSGLKVYIADINESSGTIMMDILKPTSGGSSGPSSGTSLSCSTPGQTALAGDKVVFPIVIQNNNNEDKTYTLSATSGTGWSLRFTSGDKGIYKVFVPKMQSSTVNLEVSTNAATGVGEKKITATVDDKNIDLYVHITSINQSAEVTTKVTSKIASIGDKIYYDVRIKNLQSKENIYKLSATGLPENWYFRYKEDISSIEEMAEVVIPAAGEKNLLLEIVPPNSVATGDYNFKAVVTTPEAQQIEKDLMLRLKSSVDMSMTSSKLGYSAKPGEAFNIDVYITNTGNGAALTNVGLETKAPEGWLVQVTPNSTNSIKAGQTQTFRVKVTPPGNIVASDYDITIKAKSDQATKEKDYRITITVDSYIPYIGGAIIVLVVAGLFIVYRKYGRR
ncbi:NEW3 domain-containing protein [Methanocella sp. MCL-LM]|uniref:COG1470 family protein n=1 Tax=Methanocella sp. MCL-LM TaxID=3412035 RepID=UPI003C78949E